MNRFQRPARAFIDSQNKNLDVETIEVFLPGLPAPLDGYRIAVIADLHMRRLGPFHRTIVDTIAQAGPECILIAGDTMDERTELIAALAPFFEELSAIAPTVAILGNNDCLAGRIFSLRSMYRAGGVTLLENETRLLAARGGALRIIGMMDPRAIRVGIEPEHAYMRSQYMRLQDAIPAEERAAEEIPSILLLHQPQLAPQYAVIRPSLIISGHAHGGQFRLPNGRGLYAPGQGLLPRMTSGLYALDGTQLVVSRGLGNHVFPLRLNNRPHLPMVILRQGGNQP